MDQALVFSAVVAARFLVPLLIPRFPLPAIVAALVLDGVDQTIFQAFGYDPPGYQGYDKAMDVYYLSIAYLTTMRNWTSESAVGVARFLYFYRLVGVVAFELTDWRPLLMVFPNTFEYFFIAYEVVRTRWRPDRCSVRFWVLTAAAIWIFVKLPQEYWIHIAQLDVTDLLGEYPWAGVAIGLLLAVVAVAVGTFLRPRLPATDHAWQLTADPLPAGIRTAPQRERWVAAHGRLLSASTAEKVVLVGLLLVIYAQVLPGRDTSALQFFLGVAVLVVINTAVILWVARGARGVESVALAFGIRVLLNVGLVSAAAMLLDRGRGDLQEGSALFFVVLLSLTTLLDDRYRPIHEYRTAGHPEPSDPGTQPDPDPAPPSRT
ncbi:hypothetical protein [Cryptosporangium aurantiacum]|uniref:Uncharacterized protein n=1 Tax=Cryptosporangium aurantiacum TaxID=134849 RepID=A0A1M7Q3S9_9ACTN|nr:hypothetical protein [Cryptosporangium aurantiacum]SHN24895.1 hypothetical protein SAMN05443668_104103 [Cryptosporangium aurantiacum]